MIRPTAVEARENYRIWLRYSDGSEGEVDLSHLSGRGVFAAWNDPDRFNQVFVTPAGGIAWGEDIELCPDDLYLRLTGKSIEDVMLGTRFLVENA